jgi:hypothetical protein
VENKYTVLVIVEYLSRLAAQEESIEAQDGLEDESDYILIFHNQNYT